MPNNYQNKVCLVTGAAIGIGFAMSDEMAADGATVIMTDIDEQTVADSAERLTKSHPSAFVESQRLNVSERDAFETVIRQVVEKHGRLDYIFNNAGINTMADFRDVTPELWRKIVDVNLWGVIHGTEIAYQQMVKQGHGHIVNIASGLGLVPAPRNIPYSTTKFAVVGLSESLRIEAKDLGVNVSVVCPGWIATPQVQQGRAIMGDDAKTNGADVSIEQAAQVIPLGLHPVEKTAKTILRGVLKNKPRIIFPGYVRWSSRIYKFCAPIADLWFRYEIRAFRRMRDK